MTAADPLRALEELENRIYWGDAEHQEHDLGTAAIVERLRAALTASEPVGFQDRVHEWILACFGAEIGADVIERNHRFIEEALELVQANGCTRSEAHQLVDYVFDRPVGDPIQEVGGVLNTLAALCTAAGIEMDEAGEIELRRVWTKVEKIRAKQAAKPKHSPLPEHVQHTSPQPSAWRDVAVKLADAVKGLNRHFGRKETEAGYAALAEFEALQGKTP